MQAENNLPYINAVTPRTHKNSTSTRKEKVQPIQEEKKNFFSKENSTNSRKEF